MWIKDNYPNWNLLSSSDGSVFFSPKSNAITEHNINEIKNHFQYLQRNQTYFKVKKNKTNEDTWKIDSICIPHGISLNLKQTKSDNLRCLSKNISFFETAGQEVT
nr:14680_t:CDS:2 [Entrophospora candida]